MRKSNLGTNLGGFQFTLYMDIYSSIRTEPGRPALQGVTVAAQSYSLHLVVPLHVRDEIHRRCRSLTPADEQGGNDDHGSATYNSHSDSSSSRL
jgi:hypothetical protein